MFKIKFLIIGACVVLLLIIGGIFLYFAGNLSKSTVDIPKSISKNVVDLLPPGAQVIETEDLASVGIPNRSVVLWMINPEKHTSESYKDGRGTCFYMGDEYLTGTTRISLVDNKNVQLINTIEIKRPSFANKEDSFLVPSVILEDNWLWYFGTRSATTDDTKTIKAKIISFNDYTGDGSSLEFPLFYRGGCMQIYTALAGYSIKQDKIIFIPVNNEFWNLSTFAGGPTGVLSGQYSIDYRGRGGCLTEYKIRFDSSAEKFIQSSNDVSCLDDEFPR